jgi:hypothetical protein
MGMPYGALTAVTKSQQPGSRCAKIVLNLGRLAGVRPVWGKDVPGASARCGECEAIADFHGMWGLGSRGRASHTQPGHDVDRRLRRDAFAYRAGSAALIISGTASVGTCILHATAHAFCPIPGRTTG